MRIEELKKRLHQLGADISEKTLRRWGSEGIIKDHGLNIPGTGRGNVEDWSEQALEEAAAVWAAQMLSQKQADKGTRKRKNLSTKEIFKIKEIARLFFKSGEVIHEFPDDFDFKTPNPSYLYSYQDLETKIVKGPLDDLVKTWIAARAKARWNLNIRSAVKVIVHFNPRLKKCKNKGVPPHKWERVFEEEGLLEDVPPEPWDFQLRRIPVRFRNVKNERMKQECGIPEGSPTLESFWERRSEAKTDDEIDHLIRETTKDWSYLPTGWTFKFGGVGLEASPSDKDELVVIIDGENSIDSRQKALYAPFNEYSPYEIYDHEHLGRFY